MGLQMISLKKQMTFHICELASDFFDLDKRRKEMILHTWGPTSGFFYNSHS